MTRYPIALQALDVTDLRVCWNDCLQWRQIATLYYKIKKKETDLLQNLCDVTVFTTVLNKMYCL